MAKTCIRRECSNIVDPSDPDALPGSQQCGDCTRAVRRRNRERFGFGFVTKNDHKKRGDK